MLNTWLMSLRVWTRIFFRLNLTLALGKKIDKKI